MQPWNWGVLVLNQEMLKGSMFKTALMNRVVWWKQSFPQGPNPCVTLKISFHLKKIALLHLNNSEPTLVAAYDSWRQNKPFLLFNLRWKHSNEVETMVLAGLAELVGIHFISIRWSLNIPLEMLIMDADAFRFCSNKSTHTHTYGPLSRSDLLIQKIWRCKLRAVDKPDLSIHIELWSKLDTLLSIWEVGQLSVCLLNMNMHSAACIYVPASYYEYEVNIY